MTLREIQQSAANPGEGPSWTEALAREDLALTTVRTYGGDLETFFRWFGPSE
jgi:hypothetical protein